MSRSIFHSLTDDFQFGKYIGQSLKTVIETHPDYLMWCLDNLSHLKLSSDLIEDIHDNYPDFPGNDFLDEHVLHETDYRSNYHFYHRNDYYDEPRHYEEYAGTYVQDVMGWSDEMIDDALDGDPDAYWNID